ncbi:MAG: exodeoxyribonuclease VII small subunit [Verrucomicrobiales bacterium]|nr:exodeoxyribonuclease VII small subunit [Verrucomicrobiales bacterium]
MPKPASQNETPNYDDLSFEEAMEALESLVRGVDHNRIPLNEMITGYEKGIQLHKLCVKRLDEARGRIELIRKRNDEEAELEAFGASAGNEAQPTTQQKKTQIAPASAESESDESPNLQDGELF